MKSRFKVGQKVYMGRGDKMQTLTVKEIIQNPMLPIRQYAFEEVGFICGEQSIRATIDGRDLKLGECFRDDAEDDVLTSINTRANGMGKTIFNGVFDNKIGNLFFKPDLIFSKWLVEYANGRMIIDIGCGQGHLVRMIKKMGGKVMGLEPNFDYLAYTKMRSLAGTLEGAVNEVMPMRVQDADKLIQGLGDKALLVFARTNQGGFVEDGLDIMPNGMEALFITIPNTVDVLVELGKYEPQKKLIQHKGVSEDSEVVYSIKK